MNPDRPKRSQVALSQPQKPLSAVPVPSSKATASSSWRSFNNVITRIQVVNDLPLAVSFCNFEAASGTSFYNGSKFPLIIPPDATVSTTLMSKDSLPQGTLTYCIGLFGYYILFPFTINLKIKMMPLIYRPECEDM